MDADELVRLPGKRLTDPGAWHSGKMPKAAFPLSKSKSYRLGGNWRWRVCNIEAGDEACLLLVAYNSSKLNYQAFLGLCRGEDTVLIGRYEYHATHEPPWHFHGKSGDIDQLVPGIVKGAQEYREDSPETERPCPTTDEDALAVALRFYQIDLDDDFELLPHD